MHHSPTHGVFGPGFIIVLMFSACSGGFLARAWLGESGSDFAPMLHPCPFRINPREHPRSLQSFLKLCIF